MLERAISLWKNKDLGTCKLIEGERIKILKKIGDGHFGEVFQGELSADRGENSNILKMNSNLKEFQFKGPALENLKKIPCAIKTIKRMTKQEELELVEKLQKYEETHTEEELQMLEEYEAMKNKRRNAKLNEDEELR